MKDACKLAPRLGVKFICRVRPDFDALGRHIGDELADAVLNVAPVGCALHVLRKLGADVGQRFICIAQHGATPCDDAAPVGRPRQCRQ